MDKRFVSRFGLFIFLNFAFEKKQIRYLWSYVDIDRLGGVFAPASMENRACLMMGLSTR